jgi:polar amino acid transport system substrate-binding protein
MTTQNPRLHRRGSVSRLATGASVVAAAMTVLTGCGNDSASSSSSNDGADAKLGASQFGLEEDPDVAALVPEEFKSEPVVNAIFNDGAPQSFLDDGELTGVTVDLAEALSEVMGITYEIESIGNWDTLIPGLQNGRYDISMSGFGVTLEREEVVSFVHIYDLGTSFAVKEGSNLEIAEGADLCGHSVGALSGSFFLPQADALSAECEAAGEPPLQIQQFPTQSAAVLAVKNSRVEAFGSSTDTIGYIEDQPDAGLSAQPFVYESVPHGFGLPKDSELSPAIAAGLKALIDDGAYQEILDKWGMGAGAITADDVTMTPVPGAS